MTSLPSISERPDELRKRSLATITTLTMIGAWLIVPAYIISGQQTGEQGYYIQTINGLALAILATISFVLQQRGFQTASSWLLVLSIGIAIVVGNLGLASLGAILAIISVLVTVNIAWQTMSTNHARIASVISVVLGIATFLFDALLPENNRIIATALIQQTFIVAGGIVILILSINLLQYFSFSSIRTRIILAFAIVAFIPIMVLFIPLLLEMEHNRQVQTQAEVKNVATEAANHMETKLGHLITNLETNTRLPGVRNFQPTQNYQILLTDTLRALSKNDAYALAYGVINYDGLTIADIRAYRVGLSEKENTWFQQALAKRSTYISDVVYDTYFLRPVFYVSTPIFNDAEEVVAVLRVEYDVAFIFDTLSEYSRSIEGNIAFMLIDSNNIILTNTQRPDLSFKTVTLLDDVQLKTVQDAGLLPPGTATENFSGMSGLAAQMEANADSFRAKIFPGDEQMSFVGIHPLQNKPWRVVFYQAEQNNLSSFASENAPGVLIFIFVAIAVAFAANQTASAISQPLNNLTTIAKEIGTGNLSLDIRTSRKDEIGGLANIFDDTLSQLRNIMETMETRVSQRTKELLEANEKITKRADELKTIADLSQLVTSLPSLDILLPQVTEKIGKSFGCYHVGIFMMDPGGEYAILAATNSAGGRKMLERGYKVRSGQIGVIGYTISTGQPRIALDVGEDATFFNNPDLPLTRSELTLPMMNGNRIMGVMDLQSDQPAAFAKEDVEILMLLSEQLSIGIQNARAFEETSKALHEAQTLYQKAVSTSWREIISQETTIFHYTRGTVEQILPGNELPQANLPSTLNLPIIVRGQALGQMEIRTSKPLNLSEQELRIYKSIIDRLAFTLENARLFRDAQKLATKERIIGEISTRLGATNNLDNILETAVKEIGQVIPDTEVVIQLTPGQEAK